MLNTERQIDSLPLLIAEDNEINLKVLTIILDKNGIKYHIAKDGGQAVDLYKKTKFCLVLMDCQMPVKDGLQASREIRDLEIQLGNHRCPIIALTANAMSGDKERCFSVGIDDFLSKPFNSKDLIQLIRKWTQKEEGVSE